MKTSKFVAPLSPKTFLTVFAAILAMTVSVHFAMADGNEQIKNFTTAKKFAFGIYESQPYTIYCHCRVYQDGKDHLVDLNSCGYKPVLNPKGEVPARATKMEWEHVVPAEAFGQSFAEWREGDPDKCVKVDKQTGEPKPFKGRKCAEKNPEFSRMEGDLYNLWPEVGQLNGLRDNFSMAQLTGSDYDFGQCKAKVQDRKFEPMDGAKGIVARTYMYMEMSYPGRGIISDKNQKLFEAWDKMYPVKNNPWECQRAKIIQQIQGNENTIVSSRCKDAGMW